MNFSKIIGFTSLFALITLSVQAQTTTPETGSFGLRASLFGQNAIEVPYQFNESLSIAPYFGLSATENSTTNVSFGLSPRYYFGGNEDLSTYATGQLGFQNTSFSNSNNSNFGVNVGIGYGAEYFFGPSFSISGDANLNASFGDVADNLSTLARVSVSYYF
ncbi:outer membrane beta-barrel protein [Gracilimonas tropica]|uniref:outer membrane beta-barrel protein n=1 Tax=Gracilimonas tropica TaxID=454600 RepID=UPI00035CB750|nr:outer membrane beta-barrel protein [Gracilimonas tropica]